MRGEAVTARGRAGARRRAAANGARGRGWYWPHAGRSAGAASLLLLLPALAGAARRSGGAVVPPALGVTEALFSWHAPGGWDPLSETWYDASGNGRTAVASAVPFSAVKAVARQLTAPPGERGAAKAVTYLAGSKGVVLQFGSDPLPANFTVCSVTRVPEVVDDEALLPAGAFGAAASGNRVLAATAGLWVHGHDRGLSGVAAYNQDTYKTGGDNATGAWAWANSGDWLYMCASNAGSEADAASPCSVYVNGDSYVEGEFVCQTRGGSAGSGVLAVNAQALAAAADARHAAGVWAVAEVAVWSRWLTDAELRRVTLSLQLRYGFAAAPPAPAPPPAPGTTPNPPAPSTLVVVTAPQSSNAIVAGLAIVASLLAIMLLFAASARHAARRRGARAASARKAFKYDVFLSYRRNDFAVVDGVADKLAMEGLRVFLDRGGAMSGRPFDAELLLALHGSACCTPVITLHAMCRLANVGAAELDYTLCEYVLALHFSLVGKLKLLYPLMVGEEVDTSAAASGGARPRWDLLWGNAAFKAARDALPDVVPTATLEFADTALRAQLGAAAALHSALRAATVRQIMCARGTDAGFTGLLMHDACALTGLQEDAELYIRHRYAANVKSLLYGPRPAARAGEGDAPAAAEEAGARQYQLRMDV